MTTPVVTLCNEAHSFRSSPWIDSDRTPQCDRVTTPDADLIDYLRWSKSLRGHSPNTISARERLLTRLAIHLGTPLRVATAADLERFERVGIAGRSTATRRAYASHIRCFYRWLLVAGAITDDPSTVLTMPLSSRNLPRPIEEEDLALAVAMARPKMRAILTLAGWAGMRCGEIAALDWSDLRREPNGRAFLHIRRAKGRKDRTVEVGRVVIDALQAWGMQRRGPMFLGAEGRQATADTISRSGNAHLARLGVPATMHQLRHRFASVAYQLSRDLRLVQEMLGHASPQTTAGYARPSDEAAARMVAAMDALISPRERTA